MSHDDSAMYERAIKEGREKEMSGCHPYCSVEKDARCKHEINYSEANNILLQLESLMEEFKNMYAETDEEIPVEIQLHKIQQSIDCLFTCVKGLEGKQGLHSLQIHGEFSKRIEKLEGYMTMEDRVTAYDVLNQLAKIEKNFEDVRNELNDIQDRNTGFSVMISALENRVKDIEYRLGHIIELPYEIDLRLQDVERIIDKIPDNYIRIDKELEKRIEDLEKNKYVKPVQYFGSQEPHKCPVCSPGILNEALAQVSLQQNPGAPLICPACKGTGIE